MTAIEQRYREQVQEPDRHRQDGRELDQWNETEARHLPRHLCDADRAAQLVGRLTAGDDAADIAERAVDDRPGLLDRQHNSLWRSHRMQFEVFRRRLIERLMPRMPIRCTLPNHL